MRPKLVKYQGYLYQYVPSTVRYAGTTYNLVLSYWTPPPNSRAAKQRAKESLLFLQKLIPLLTDDKVDDGMRDVFRSSFSQIAYPFQRMLDHGYLEQFDSAHEAADTYSQLSRWLNTDGMRELITKSKKWMDEFVKEVQQRPLYDYDTSTEFTVDPREPLSEAAIRFAKDAYDDDQEHREFTKDVLPVFDLFRELPEHLAALDDYLHAIEYKRDLVSKQFAKRGPGDPRPDVAEREIVWHATTALPAILKGGFKTREELGEAAGLGGSVQGISFTGSLHIAQQIAQAMLDAVTVLQGPRTLDAIFSYADTIGVPSDELLELFRAAWGGKPKVEADGKVALQDAFNLVRFALNIAEQKGKRYDPLFFDTSNLASKFQAMNPKDIGVVEAVVDTTDPQVEYLHSMEEWRVPLSGILSYGPVGSQKI